MASGGSASKNNGFTRLKPVDTFDTESEEEYDESVPLYKTSYAWLCARIFYHGLLLLLVILLLTFVVFGGYMVFQMQAEIMQLRQGLEKLTADTNRSSFALDTSELQSQLQANRASAEANFTKLARLHSDNWVHMDSLRKDVDNAAASVKKSLDQLSAHDQELSRLSELVDRLSSRIQSSIADHVSRLTEDVDQLKIEVQSLHEDLTGVANSTSGCVTAVNEASRHRGELLQDIYLLNRSNYTMNLVMSKISLNVSTVQENLTRTEQYLLSVNKTLQSYLVALKMLKSYHLAPSITSTRTQFVGLTSSGVLASQTMDVVESTEGMSAANSSPVALLTSKTESIRQSVVETSSDASLLTISPVPSITSVVTTQNESPISSTVLDATQSKQVSESATSTTMKVTSTAGNSSLNVMAPSSSSFSPSSSVFKISSQVLPASTSNVPSPSQSSSEQSQLVQSVSSSANKFVSASSSSTWLFLSPSPTETPSFDSAELKTYLENIVANFDKADTDSDGFLSADEFSEERHSQSSLRIFSLLDDSKDDKLSKQEIRKVLELLPNN